MYLVFDIGGTKMRFATSTDGRELGEAKIFQTPQSFEKSLAFFTNVKDSLLKGERPTAVAGGLPGIFNHEKTMLFRAPNVPDWQGKPLKQELERIFGCVSFLENDAALAALGEAAEGAGKGHAIVAYITIGTGVGGARVVDAVVDRNSHGFEIGHQLIAAGAQDLDDHISGHALLARYGAPPSELHDPAIWEAVAEELARGVHNAIVHWSPDIVVIGGAVGHIPLLSLDRVSAHLKQTLTIFPELPPLQKGLLGDFAGLWGALRFIKM